MEEVDVAVWLQREMIEDLCLFCWWFSKFQLVRYPVPVEEVEGVAIHVLRGSSLYTLELFDRNKIWTVGLCIKWREQEIVLYRIKFAKGAFTVIWLNYIAIIHVAGWSELCVSILETRIHGWVGLSSGSDVGQINNCGKFLTFSLCSICVSAFLHSSVWDVKNQIEDRRGRISG